LQEINQKGTTIILTTHYLEEAESLCKRVAIIDRGDIIADTSTKKLLAKLDKETLVLDLQEPLAKIPIVEGFEFKQIDPVTLEASFYRHTSLNALFEILTANSVKVVSLRNKMNRLEGLFLELVKANKEKA
jgi:ABC-2 type transport system ATP-binding protein